MPTPMDLKVIGSLATKPPKRRSQDRYDDSMVRYPRGLCPVRAKAVKAFRGRNSGRERRAQRPGYQASADPASTVFGPKTGPRASRRRLGIFGVVAKPATGSRTDPNLRPLNLPKGERRQTV